jgi:hypothetical protein
MAGGAETSNIAALPAIARLGTCQSARGPDADWHVKLSSQFAVEGHSRALIHKLIVSRLGIGLRKDGPRPRAQLRRAEKFLKAVLGGGRSQAHSIS